MTTPKRKPARMKPVEAWAVVKWGRIQTSPGTSWYDITGNKSSIEQMTANERIVPVRIVEIAAPKKRSRK